MIISLMDIIEAVQAIIPDAQMGVYIDDGNYLGPDNAISFEGHRISWSVNNASPMPDVSDIYIKIAEMKKI